MQAARIGKIAAITTLLITLFYMALTYTSLPDRIAVHFGPNNEPNRWENKSSLFLWYPLLLLGVNIFHLGILSKVSSKIPDSMLSMPRKKYWLSEPEKKMEAIHKLNAIIPFTASFVNILFLYAYHVIYLENISKPPYHIPYNVGVSFIIGIALVFVVGIFVYLFVSLRPPKKRANEF